MADDIQSKVLKQNERSINLKRKPYTREALPAGGGLAQGRFTAKVLKDAEPAQTARRRSANAGNLKPQPRASLVELSNEADQVVFHYNPSSYKIGKKAGWKTKDAGTGPKTLEWGGPGLTEVSFSVLLDDMSHPAKTGGAILSTEDTLQWLFQRCENRDVGQLRLSRQPLRRVSWMSSGRQGGNTEPPVLVLFGVSFPFTCRLMSVDVTSSFQGKNPFTPTPPQNTSLGELRRFEADQARQQRGDQSFYIQRATVELKLAEYNAAPQTENKKA